MLHSRVSRDRRVPLLAKAELSQGGQVVPTIVRDLSRGGMQLLLSPADAAQLDAGRPLTLTTELPRRVGRLCLQVTQVWSQATAQATGVEAIAWGVQFQSLSAEVEARLVSFLAGFRETVVVVDSAEGAKEVESILGAHYDVLGDANPGVALNLMSELEVAVLIVREGTVAENGAPFLEEFARRFPAVRTVKVVLGEPSASAEDDSSEAAAKVFYFLQRPFAAADLLAVVRSAAAQYWSVVGKGVAAEDVQHAETDRARSLQRVLEVSRQLAMQTDVRMARRLMVDGLTELVAADRAYCLLYDSISERFWSEEDEAPERTLDANHGVAGFVARTGAMVRLPVAKADARYRPALDDPRGTGDEHLTCVPVSSPGGRVLAVLIALREGKSPDFSAADLETVKVLATQSAAVFGQMALESQIEQVFANRVAAADEGVAKVFRQDAVDHRRRGVSMAGQLLQVYPSWTRWAYRLLVVVLVVALAFAVVGRMNEYVSGPALVRIEGRTELAATTGGIVAAVEVQPDEEVEAGRVLVRFNDAAEVGTLERADREFELQLVKILKDPADQAARSALASLRAERELAQSRLRERTLVAPHAGRVSDIRIHPGQHLAVGERVLSLSSGSSELGVIALLPGSSAPLLKPGMLVRLEVAGFKYAYQTLTIESVGREIVGPAEARRYLGPEVADSVTISGPVLLVRARLPSDTFVSEHKTYRYQDGMQGTIECAVRKERILFSLIPGLRGVGEGADG